MHHFIVTVDGCTHDQAHTVMRERLGHDEDYGFEYSVDFTDSTDLKAEAKDALEGDSNDAEHDALVSVAGYFDIEYTSFEEREMEEDEDA
jgi:hypothetical protein